MEQLNQRERIPKERVPKLGRFMNKLLGGTPYYRLQYQEDGTSRKVLVASPPRGDTIDPRLTGPDGASMYRVGDARPPYTNEEYLSALESDVAKSLHNPQIPWRQALRPLVHPGRPTEFYGDENSEIFINNEGGVLQEVD